MQCHSETDKPGQDKAITPTRVRLLVRFQGPVVVHFFRHSGRNSGRTNSQQQETLITDLIGNVQRSANYDRLWYY